ncbi:MAG: general secretion pathway protein GspK [Candidatus Omnitrophica bacterium]|nr:general secretion pathway protein GspK [Candidatus Omnitrophota bacterium]
MRTGGSRNVDVDAMYLRVTYSIDTLTEPWATGSYAAFPISLSNGTIESITITDEERKVHLNYASQALLSNLLTNLSISSASTKATNIVNYRGAGLTNPFDTVEELQQVTGITASDYNTIKDYVTVYSFVNSNVFRPTGPRAPVNINTAPFEVLKSIFDSLSLGAGDPTSLADDIVTQRNSAPFVGFYSSTSTSNTYFYNFVMNRGYLSASGDPDERDRVLDNADASSLVPVSGSNGYNAVTTEFCYASTAFYINTLAKAKGRNFRVKTIRGYDGSRTFSTYVGDPTPAGWRKENFE